MTQGPVPTPSTPNVRRRQPRNSFMELLYGYAEALFKVSIRAFTLWSALIQKHPLRSSALAATIQYSFVGRLLPALLTSFALIQSPSVLRMVEGLQDLREGVESIALTLPSAVQSEKEALSRLGANPSSPHSHDPVGDEEGKSSPSGDPLGSPSAFAGAAKPPRLPPAWGDDFTLSLDWWHDLLYSTIFLSARMGGIMITYHSEKLQEREAAYQSWLNLPVLQAGLAPPEHEQGKRDKLLDDIIHSRDQVKGVWEAL